LRHQLEPRTPRESRPDARPGTKAHPDSAADSNPSGLHPARASPRPMVLSRPLGSGRGFPVTDGRSATRRDQPETTSPAPPAVSPALAVAPPGALSGDLSRAPGRAPAPGIAAALSRALIPVLTRALAATLGRAPAPMLSHAVAATLLRALAAALAQALGPALSQALAPALTRALGLPPGPTACPSAARTAGVDDRASRPARLPAQ
jgi:hypothetical protein